MRLRANFSTRAGFLLVAAGLAVWLLTAGLGFNFEPFTSYSILIIPLGILLVAIGVWCGDQRSSRSAAVVTCPKCGWYGPAPKWDEYEGCPKCDNEQGDRMSIQ